MGVAFVVPALILLLLFLAYPLVLGIWLGFTDTMVGRKGEFIGLANYISLLQDRLFWLVTYYTFLYTGAAVLFKLILGFALAIVLNREFRAKGFVRAIVLLPWIIPTVLSAICFWWLFDTTFSGITWILLKAGPHFSQNRLPGRPDQRPNLLNRRQCLAGNSFFHHRPSGWSADHQPHAL